MSRLIETLLGIQLFQLIWILFKSSSSPSRESLILSLIMGLPIEIILSTWLSAEIPDLINLNNPFL